MNLYVNMEGESTVITLRTAVKIFLSKNILTVSFSTLAVAKAEETYECEQRFGDL